MRKINDIYYYTPQQICELLDIERYSLNYARMSGSLPFSFIKIMSHYLYNKDEVDNYIESLTNKNDE
jgi:hypothetical protein